MSQAIEQSPGALRWCGLCAAAQPRRRLANLAPFPFQQAAVDPPQTSDKSEIDKQAGFCQPRHVLGRL
jgi:hypothetical protein